MEVLGTFFTLCIRKNDRENIFCSCLQAVWICIPEKFFFTICWNCLCCEFSRLAFPVLLNRKGSEVSVLTAFIICDEILL